MRLYVEDEFRRGDVRGVRTKQNSKPRAFKPLCVLQPTVHVVGLPPVQFRQIGLTLGAGAELWTWQRYCQILVWSWCRLSGSTVTKFSDGVARSRLLSVIVLVRYWYIRRACD